MVKHLPNKPEALEKPQGHTKKKKRRRRKEK
jgi:hypothetical protein